jgi:hypothetical protein
MASKPLNRLKRWLSDGPTVAFARRYRYGCWAFNLLLYILLNLFYLRVQTGAWLPWQSAYEYTTLTEQLLSPLNIFDFPAQIFVVGLLMTLLCVVPILIAQLYNIWHAIPFIAVALFCGHQQIFSLCLLVSCVAVSFEPFRFKSKFVAAVMCLLPELLYVIIFSGSNPESDALRWAVLYAPWGFAFIFSLAYFGIVLGIGHFVRYRPGVISPVFGLVLAGTVLLFDSKIGMNERDFQAYVYQYRPETIVTQLSKDIQPLLEKEKAKRLELMPFLYSDTISDTLLDEWKRAFQPSFFESDMLRESTEAILIAIIEARKFVHAKEGAIQNMDRFIEKYPNDKRVADALYYKGLLLDLKPNVRRLEDQKRLGFYTDIPSLASEAAWQLLLERFAELPLALEARWRLAYGIACREAEPGNYAEQFRQATAYLMEAQNLCQALMQLRKEKVRQAVSDTTWMPSMSDIFNPKLLTLSDDELKALHRRIGKLRAVLAKENHPGLPIHEKRLAEFVRLDPYQLDYETRLKALTLNSPSPDPLLDNVELARAMIKTDPDQRRDLLSGLVDRYPEQDGGVSAKIELAKVYLEKYNRSANEADRNLLRTQGQGYLQEVLTQRPDSYFAQQAQELLSEWPGVIRVETTNGDS